MQGKSKSRAPTEIDVIVGERIRAERRRQQMSLEELAAKIGVRHQQLQKYETGVNRVSAGMLWKIANVQGIPLEAYFTFELIGQNREDAIADLRAATNALIDEIKGRVGEVMKAARNLR